MPEEAEKPSGPRSRKGARTRARLLDAAKQIFEESGYFEARISDIAERAGLSHGSFYHYFDSKEQAFREVAERIDEELSAPLFEIILAPASHVRPDDRIRESVRVHFRSYAAEARMLGVIEQVARHDEHLHAARQARNDRYTGEIAESIRRLQQRGWADESLDPALAAVAMGALTTRFAEMWLVQGAVDYDLEDGIEQFARLFVNAIGLRDRAPV